MFNMGGYKGFIEEIEKNGFVKTGTNCVIYI